MHSIPYLTEGGTSTIDYPPPVESSNYTSLNLG
jgi:hypothetical protein